MNILDLPLEEQKRIAKEVFGISHADWVLKTKKDFAKTAEFLKTAKSNKDDEMTPQERERYRKKIDSGNQPS